MKAIERWHARRGPYLERCLDLARQFERTPGGADAGTMDRLMQQLVLEVMAELPEILEEAKATAYKAGRAAERARVRRKLAKRASKWLDPCVQCGKKQVIADRLCVWCFFAEAQRTPCSPELYEIPHEDRDLWECGRNDTLESPPGTFWNPLSAGRQLRLGRADRARQLRASGLTWREVGLRLGVSGTYAQVLARGFGAPTPRGVDP